jgi:cytochrome P450
VSVIDEMNLRVFQPYRKFFPSNWAHVRKLDTLDALMSSMIKARRAAPRREPIDLLDVLLTAPTVDEVQVADELKTMLLAGHETSSLMLTWTTYLLATHPEALAKAVAEVDATFDALAAGSTTSGLSGPVDAAISDDSTEDAAPSNLPAVVPGSPFDRFRRMNYVLKVCCGCDSAVLVFAAAG